MNKRILITLYGSLIVLTGLFLVIFHAQPIDVIKYTVASSLAVCAALSFVTTLKIDNRKVSFIYLNLHAVTLLTYSLSLFFACFSMETFSSFSSVYFIFYSFSEIIFCFWLFNLKSLVGIKILIQRLVTAGLVGVGTLVLLSNFGNSQKVSLIGFGILLVLTGINAFFYKPIMQALETPDSASL
jgi:hypothetical protein